MGFGEWGRCFGGHDEHYSPLSVCQTNPLINYADTAKSEMVRSGMPTEQRTENPRVGGSIPPRIPVDIAPLNASNFGRSHPSEDGCINQKTVVIRNCFS